MRFSKKPLRNPAIPVSAEAMREMTAHARVYPSTRPLLEHLYVPFETQGKRQTARITERARAQCRKRKNKRHLRKS